MELDLSHYTIIIFNIFLHFPFKAESRTVMCDKKKFIGMY